MTHQFYRSTGVSLGVGSSLAIVTMILHPSGGGFTDIISQAPQMKMAHSIAIGCIPFMLFGFYGLSRKLSEERKLSKLALIIAAFGLFAAMLAALFNGLILPDFLSQYSQSLAQNETTLKVIVKFSFTINKALDYVFIIALTAAIVLYSILIIQLKRLSKVLGYFGLLILVLAMLGGLSDFAFTSLIGFRIFVFSIAAWILWSGVALSFIKKK